MLREIVVLLSVVSLVKCSQNCWLCSNEPDLAVCRSRTVTCLATEQCFLEKIYTNTNQIHYSAGCRSSTVCNMMSTFSGGVAGKRSIPLCGQCCTGPNCQDNLCGLTPSAGSTNMMTCLSCNLAPSASSCLNSQVCQDTEVCYAGITVVGSLLRYTVGCKQKHLCKTLAENEVVGHPGRDIVNGVQICDACCVGDQCNKADCFILKQNMTVAMFS